MEKGRWREKSERDEVETKVEAEKELYQRDTKVMIIEKKILSPISQCRRQENAELTHNTKSVFKSRSFLFTYV